MKIQTLLFVNEVEAEISDCCIRLDLFTPGRAVISLTGLVPVKAQSIEVRASMGGEDYRRVFWGYIEDVTEKQSGVYEVIAREFAAILNQRIAINLRHCTPSDVLAAVADQTGLQFVLPENSWTTQTIPRFQHVGGGYMVLDKLLTLWSVTDGVWQQQSDGRVYVGESLNSVPGSKTISLPVDAYKSHSITGGSLPLVPRIRPGVRINLLDETFVVHAVEIKGDSMRLQWMTNPWSTHLEAVS